MTASPGCVQALRAAVCVCVGGGLMASGLAPLDVAVGRQQDAEPGHSVWERSPCRRHCFYGAPGPCHRPPCRRPSFPPVLPWKTTHLKKKAAPGGCSALRVRGKPPPRPGPDELAALRGCRHRFYSRGLARTERPGLCRCRGAKRVRPAPSAVQEARGVQRPEDVPQKVHPAKGKAAFTPPKAGKVRAGHSWQQERVCTGVTGQG